MTDEDGLEFPHNNMSLKHAHTVCVCVYDDSLSNFRLNLKEQICLAGQQVHFRGYRAH